jgi:hypothetical protein
MFVSRFVFLYPLGISQAFFGTFFSPGLSYIMFLLSKQFLAGFPCAPLCRTTIFIRIEGESVCGGRVWSSLDPSVLFPLVGTWDLSSGVARAQGRAVRQPMQAMEDQ